MVEISLCNTARRYCQEGGCSERTNAMLSSKCQLPDAKATLRFSGISLKAWVTWLQKRTGSLSSESSDNQANGSERPCGEAAHCASKAVLPNPAGADTSKIRFSRPAVTAEMSLGRGVSSVNAWGL